MDLEKIKEDVKGVLSEKRFIHSVNVMDKCEELAKRFGVDVEKAKLVGITHDIAKEMTIDEMFQYVQDNEIAIDDIAKKFPKLLHAKIGADICKKRYGFSKDMTRAIEAHTTGKGGMDKLAQVLYISDAISRERDFEYVEKARELSKKDLDDTMLYLLKTFIKDCRDRNKEVHPDALNAVRDLEARER